jgi:hypothetical protein
VGCCEQDGGLPVPHDGICSMLRNCCAIKILRTSPIKFIKGKNLKPHFYVDGHKIKRKKYNTKWLKKISDFQPNVKVDCAALWHEIGRS